MRVAYCTVNYFERDSSAFRVSRYESTQNSISETEIKISKERFAFRARVRVSSEGSRLTSRSIDLNTRSNRARYFG